MPAVSETVDIGIGVVQGEPGAFTALEQGIADAVTRGTSKALSKNKAVQDAISKLFSAGFKTEAKKLGELSKEQDRKRKKSAQEIANLERELESDITTDRRKTLDKEIRDRKKAIRLENNALEKRISSSMEATERQISLLADADKRSQKSWHERAKTAGGALSGGVENVSSSMVSGSIDPEALTKGLAKGIGGLGEMIAGKMAQSGMASSAAALSTAAAVIAGAAVAFGAIVAVFAAAYGQTKELNEEIMGTASSVDLLAGSGKNLSQTLKEVRGAALDLAYSTRLETKEVIAMMGAFNQSGITLKEVGRVVGGVGTNVSKLADLSHTAILASKGLGIEVQSYAEFTKTFIEMGNSVVDVQGAFGMISDSARRAGMNTKDFFTAINEASTGMALYNFRVGDTVGLFSDLVKILGEDLAKERIGLSKTFGTMDFEQRYKTVMTTGKKTTKGIVTAEAGRQSEQFGEKFGKDVKGLESVGGAGAIDVKALGKLSEKQFAKLLAKTYAAEGKTQDLAKQQLQTLYTISKGTKGTTAALAASLSGLSKSGEIAMELASGQALLGGKSLAEAAESPALRMFLEKEMGMSGEQLEQNIRIERALREEFESMKLSGEVAKDANFSEELAKGTLSQTETLKAAAQAEYSMVEQLGQQTYMETKSISATVKNVIAGLLEKMSGYLEYIASSSLFGGKKGSTEEAVFKELQRTNAIMDEESAKIVAKEEAIAELEKQITATKKGQVVERKQLTDQIKALEEGKKSSTRKIAVAKGTQMNIKTGATVEDAKKQAASAEFRKQHGMSPEAFASTLQKEKQIRIGTAEAVVTNPYLPNQKVMEMGFPTQQEFSSEGAPDPQYAIDQAIYDIKAGSSVEDIEKEGFEVAVKQVDLTAETVTTLSRMAARARDEEKTQEKQATSLDKILKVLDNDETNKLIAGSDLSREKVLENLKTAEGRDAIIRKINANTGADDSTRRSALAILGVGMDPKVEDFIYRGNGISGNITPINNKDEFFGAKPGGAIDKATNGGGGVIVNISGVGSANEVARAVGSTLKRLGYGNVKKYTS